MHTFTDDLFITDSDELSLVRKALASFQDSSEKRLSLRVDGKDVDLPASVLDIMGSILSHVAKGELLHLYGDSGDEEISTQAAADILNVSRPYLINKLLEPGVIQYHKVGTHRRLKLIDVIQYQQRLKATHCNIMDDLVSESQRLNLGYND